MRSRHERRITEIAWAGQRDGERNNEKRTQGGDSPFHAHKMIHTRVMWCHLGGAIAIPRSEPSTWILQSERGINTKKIWLERMDLNWQGLKSWWKLGSPFNQGDRSDLHHDSVTSLGFPGCTIVRLIRKWEGQGGTRDDDDATGIFALIINWPLNKRAGERQSSSSSWKRCITSCWGSFLAPGGKTVT